MNNAVRELFYSVGQEIIGYFPSLVAGIILIAIGWLVAWIVKRIVIQLCVLLRLDRLLRRFRWGAGFSKADLRYALFDSVGSIAFFLTFLVFLDAALVALQLSVLSSLIERGVLFFPKLFIALLIVGLGWLVAGWVAVTIQKGLIKEEVPRATLIARFSKAFLLLFFSAMALTELDIAREIVIIGFTATIITLSLLAGALTLIGGKNVTQKILKTIEEK